MQVVDDRPIGYETECHANLTRLIIYRMNCTMKETTEKLSDEKRKLPGSPMMAAKIWWKWKVFEIW